MRIGSLFSGYNGLDMAVRNVLGGSLAWVSDIDPGACKILAHHHLDVPNLGDITTVDWATVEPVDIITGGFPCQDVSMAGRRAGMKPGNRSGLWSMMAGAIDTLRPSLVVAENVRGLLSADGHADVEPCPWCMGDPDSEPPLRALGGVLGDLADIGYDAAWYGLTAASVGAPHGRFRVFVIAWPVENTDSATGGERRQPASGQTPRRWARADVGGSDRAPITDTYGAGLEASWEPGQCAEAGSGRAHSTVVGSGSVATDTRGDGWDEGWPESAGVVGGPDVAVSGGGIHWGQFEPAIRRWESILGRPAPPPTELSSRGGQRLSPMFVEFMMGLPEGHVTDVPDLSRNDQLKALGNGVVPQQAEAALRYLLTALEAA